MLTASAKLAEIFGRSLFAISCIYLLPQKSSGQFAVITTLIAFFVFFSGFERYASLQRELVKKKDGVTDLLISSAFRFFCFNYLIFIPIISILLIYWAHLTVYLTILCIIIAISEHIANEFYRITLVSSQHTNIIIMSAIKNFALLFIIFFIKIKSLDLDLIFILEAWAGLSLLSLLMSVIFNSTNIRQFYKLLPIKPTILNQYKLSLTHFKIGILGMLTLQVDRLIISGLLSLEETSLYFQHMMISILAYQVLGIISFNRVMPEVYKNILISNHIRANYLIKKEKVVYILFSLSLIIAAIILKTSTSTLNFEPARNINLIFLIILIMSYLIRGIADFNVMTLNGLHEEKKVYSALKFTVVISIFFMIIMTLLLGIKGLVAAFFIGSCIYFIITTKLLFKIFN
jgi:O-antigen/teichoic acid export membrane protein